MSKSQNNNGAAAAKKKDVGGEVNNLALTELWGVSDRPSPGLASGFIANYAYLITENFKGKSLNSEEGKTLEEISDLVNTSARVIFDGLASLGIVIAESECNELYLRKVGYLISEISAVGFELANLEEMIALHFKKGGQS